MTRYKLELEFEADDVSMAFAFVNSFTVQNAMDDDDDMVGYSLRDLEGNFKMSAQFKESKEPPAFVTPLYTPGTQYRSGDFTVMNGTTPQGVADAPTPPVGLDPTLAALAGKR